MGVREVDRGRENRIRRLTQSRSPTSSGHDWQAMRHRMERETSMNTDGVARDLAQAFTERPGQLEPLHDRLATAAQREGVLDVAYRIVDSPVGPLLLASTARGLVRVAYASEDHDAVLQALADKVSPRILQRSRPGWTWPRGNWMSTSPAVGAPSTCRWTGGCPPGSGAPSWAPARYRLRPHRQLRRRGPAGREPEGGPRGRLRLRDQPDAGRGALPPRGPLRWQPGRLPRRRRRQAHPAHPGGAHDHPHPGRAGRSASAPPTGTACAPTSTPTAVA